NHSGLFVLKTCPRKRWTPTCSSTLRPLSRSRRQRVIVSSNRVPSDRRFNSRRCLCPLSLAHDQSALFRRRHDEHVLLLEAFGLEGRMVGCSVLGSDGASACRRVLLAGALFWRLKPASVQRGSHCLPVRESCAVLFSGEADYEIVVDCLSRGAAHR